MKKIAIVLAVILAVIISVGAVSADEGWSFDLSSSSQSNSNGGQMDINNNNLDIQGYKFVIPDGYTHNESEDAVGNEAGDSFPDCFVSQAKFDKGDDSIIVKVIYSKDITFDDEVYDADESAVEKEIGDQEGYFVQEDDGGITFDFIDDGNLVEINAPDEATLTSLLKTADY